MKPVTLSVSVIAGVAIASLVSPVHADHPAAVRWVDTAVVEVGWPDAAGPAQRPVVEFNHAIHADALESEGCTVCHRIDEAGFHPGLAAVAESVGRDELIDAYHEACAGCHLQRSGEGRPSGPVTCGECHVRRPPGVSSRVAPIVDRSLHGRHANAYPENCAECHHVWDEASGKLVHRENSEEACRGCHGEVAVERSPSLRHAAHRSCVGCHLDRADANSTAGPVRCEGCHDAARLAAIEQLEEIPRLDRGQPDRAWVKGEGAVRPMVAFDHASHELRATTCSTCHHDRMQACAECHALMPTEDGGGVGLERAHHDEGTTLSCVGCHREVARRSDCAGCHRDTTVAAGDTGCVSCHNGPRAAAGDPPPVEPPPVVALAELPSPSNDLPEDISISILADEYEPSAFPHLKIIRRFDAGIRESSLARAFHRTSDAMCTGCHHHSPAGERPPKCSACHGAEGAATIDRPALKAAYHRQCVGCHQRLGIKAGCSDCHARKEGQS